MKIAYIFPGQGSQVVGMGRDIAETYPSARQVFETADECLGFPLSELCFQGPQEELNLTANTQPSLLTVSAAIATVLKESISPRISYVAGHSLGEYSALWFSDVFDLPTALRLVRARGEAMQSATPVGVGAMAAIIGLEFDAVADICRQASGEEVLQAANFNSPGQVVISGHSRAVERGIEIAKAQGAKRGMLLPVSAPFHSHLMTPAAERMAKELSAADVNTPKIPVINNADAAELAPDPSNVIDSLIRQVTAPVKWDQSVRFMVDQGVELFVEIGPGRVLSNLIRRINRDVQTVAIGDVGSLQQFITEYN